MKPGSPPVGRRSKFSSFATRLLFLVGTGVCAQAQTLLEVGGSMHLVNADQAILESQIVRKDLPCEVDPLDPRLGFDLRFHAGYEVKVPLQELAGEGNLLTMLFRVTPKDRPREAVYLVQHISVPALRQDGKGDADLTGAFDLGEGEYHIDWMMRDRTERVCSDYWDATAKLNGSEREMKLELRAGAISPPVTNQFLEDPPVARNQEAPLNVKLLVNFAPQDQESSTLTPIDTLALVTMLRRISREPRFTQFSLAAFNIQDQRVVYRQTTSDRIDFPALGGAIQEIRPGTVDLKLLANKHGEVEFLVDLIKSEMSGQERPDAVVFAGPKYMLDDSMPESQLKQLQAQVDYPVFYLNYNTLYQQLPWRDAIGNAIRVFGGKEFTISQPKDLWSAVSEMVARIVESNQKQNEAAGVP